MRTGVGSKKEVEGVKGETRRVSWTDCNTSLYEAAKDAMCTCGGVCVRYVSHVAWHQKFFLKTIHFEVIVSKNPKWHFHTKFHEELNETTKMSNAVKKKQNISCLDLSGSLPPCVPSMKF